MFKTRLISGILLVIAALLTIISGGYVLFFTLLCISLIGMQELYKAMGIHEDRTGLLEIVGYLGAVLYYISLLLGFESYGLMAVLVSLILVMFVYVFTYPKYHANQVMAAFFGVVYVAVMLSFILMTRNLPDGKFIVWLIFLCSWGCDTCAYCVGMLFGKHKLTPLLSPKKTVEGAAGGLVGGAAGVFLAGLIFGSGRFSLLIYIPLGIVLSAFSQIGDLSASMIKRHCGVKDYGNLIPGHGGLMDRLDSVLFIMPFTYLFFEIMLGGLTHI